MVLARMESDLGETRGNNKGNYGRHNYGYGSRIWRTSKLRALVQASFPRHVNVGTLLSSPGFSCNQVLRIGDIGINKAKLYMRNMRIVQSSQSQVPLVEAVAKSEPLKVMISGALVSSKGTQRDFITNKYGLVHIVARDLLREKVVAGTKNEKRAKEYMEKCVLVLDEIIVMMVNECLVQQLTVNMQDS
eukprot:Gb_23853 [translate_table: standard]